MVMTNHTVDSFDYTYAPINDLEVVTAEDPKTGKPIVDHILVQDEPLQVSGRFWISLFARYGFNKAFFKYFRHDEVFNRNSEVGGDDRMRLCIERGTNDSGEVNRLLAVSNPKKPLVVHDDLMEMLTRYDGKSITYADGIVDSTHIPRAGGTRFDCLGDSFENRFIMQTPIDGYGAPNIYLSLLRMACMNGMVGYAKVFRSSLALGKGVDDVSPSITRALDGFNHDEGYAAMRDRIENSGNSWLSVYESQTLYHLLVKLHADQILDINANRLVKGTRISEYLTEAAKDTKQAGEEAIGSPILKAFRRMTGDACESYGLANLDALSSKRQRTLPVKCKMYDALNFATEVATHYADPNGARMLQAWVGRCISDEYDMEGTADKFTEFADFLVSSKMSAGMTGSENTPEGVASLN